MYRYAAVISSAALVFAFGACSTEYDTRVRPIVYAQPTKDKTTVTLRFIGGMCDSSSDSEINIAENASTLRMAVQVKLKRRQPCGAAAVSYEVAVKLRSPLGNKTLLNENGQPISLTPPSPPVGAEPFPIKKVTYDS